MVKIFVSSICILTITLGVSRFGFTPILPIMQAEAGLGVAEGGWVTSAHYLGYLIGVIVSYTLVTTKQKEQFLMFGLLISVLSTVLMAATTSFLYWSIIRFFASSQNFLLWPIQLKNSRHFDKTLYRCSPLWQLFFSAQKAQS